MPSVGSVGDSYDNALAETVIGLFKTEVIRRLGPWRSLEAVEIATLEWVDWFNTRRLLEPIGHIPPAEAEAPLLRRAGDPACRGVGLKPTCLRETRRGSAAPFGSGRIAVRRSSACAWMPAPPCGSGLVRLSRWCASTLPDRRQHRHLARTATWRRPQPRRFSHRHAHTFGQRSMHAGSGPAFLAVFASGFPGTSILSLRLKPIQANSMSWKAESFGSQFPFLRQLPDKTRSPRH